jgi:hypothetical protein
MTEVAALEGYAGKLSEAATQATASAQKQHEYVHGGDTVDVATESGPLPSLAKQAKMVREYLLGLGSFIQAGIGAVVRTFQDKMRDSVSVKDFGAVGDGVADSAPAFVKTSAAFAQIVRVPVGSYVVNLTQGNAAAIFSLLSRIKLDGSLLINLPDSQINLTEQVVARSPDLERVSIVGAAPVTKMSTGVVGTVGSARNYLVTFAVPDVVGVAVGDYAIVRNVSGTGDYYGHYGVWRVISITENLITVLNTHAQAAFPANTVTSAVLTIIKSVLKFDGCDGFRFESAQGFARFDQVVIAGDYNLAAGTGTVGAHGIVSCAPVITHGANSNDNYTPQGNVVAGPNLGVSSFGEQGIAVSGRGHMVANYVASCSNRKRGWYAEGGHIRAKSTIGNGNGEDGFISDVNGAMRVSQCIASGNGLQGLISINNSFLGAGGSRATGNLGSGYEIRGPGRLEVGDCRSINNIASGFSASYGGMILCQGSEGSRNGITGFDAAAGGIIDAQDSTAIGNTGYGYRAQYASVLRATGANVSGNGPGSYFSRDSSPLFEASGAVSVLNVPTYSVGQRFYDSAKLVYYGFSTNSSGDMSLSSGVNPVWVFKADGVLHPSIDNGPTFGRASNRPSVLFAGTGTINTSDGREKTAVRQLAEAEIKAGLRLANELGIYQWLVEIDRKGVDEARLHLGMTVQRAMAILTEEGLDPFRYGLICHDAWGDEYETVPAVHDEDGCVVEPENERLVIAAGDRYGFRENELHSLMIKALAHEQTLIKGRLAALESRA